MSASEMLLGFYLSGTLHQASNSRPDILISTTPLGCFGKWFIPVMCSEVMTYMVQSQRSAPNEDSPIMKTQNNGDCVSQTLCSVIHRA